MSHIGEFDLIGRISARFFQETDACHLEPSSCHLERSERSPGTVGIGDDCAVMPQRDGVDTLATTDLLIEDRHFLLDDISPEQLGWKSAAVNISDIAAMGGHPTASFLSIAIPSNLGERLAALCAPGSGVPSGESSQDTDCVTEWVERFIAGFRDMSARFGVPLLGGDTSASPDKLFINVTLLGECPHGRAVLRSGARPGDLVCVTGCLGDSAAGLKLVLERVGRSSSPLIRRHYMPMPRVLEGQALASVNGVHAMMDVSDGIASDLRHILKASGSGAEIDLRALPLSPELLQLCAERGWDAVELAVSGGEDYELLFTVAPEALDAARQALAGLIAAGPEPASSVPASPCPGSEPLAPIAEPVVPVAEVALSPLPYLTVIGRIVEGGGIRWIGSDKEFKGFTHF